MPTRIAINGFGRIGRLVARILTLEHRQNLQLVAVNDLVPADSLAYLMKYDSVHGRSPYPVESQGSDLVLNNQKISVLSEKDPLRLPWKDLQVDYVIEASGRFTHLEDAQMHLKAGAKRVVITAPAKGAVPTFVMGVNHTQFNPHQDTVISNASCTTNCLAILTKVLLDHFGIEEGLMTTIHSLTASQPTVDGPSKKDLRGGRAAGVNIIPSSTGAAKAVALCLPEIKGKLTGMAFRVPTQDVSVVDLTVKLKTKTTYEIICQTIQNAANGPLKGLLEYTEDPVVSTDFIGNPASCIFDKEAGIALNDTFFKLIAWYDNEMGYSHRVVDLLRYMASQETKI